MVADPSKKSSSQAALAEGDFATETRPGLGGDTPHPGLGGDTPHPGLGGDTPHRSPEDVLRDLAKHPRGDDLARLVHAVAMAAADERRTRIEDGVVEIAERLGLQFDEAETRYGNVLAALQRGSGEGPSAATRALLGALLARGVALSPPEGPEAELSVAESLTWLAVSTPIDSLVALDAALGRRAEGFWVALARLVRRVQEGRAPLVGRAGAMVAAAAIHGSSCEAARSEANALSLEAHDPIVRALLCASSPATGHGDHAPHGGLGGDTPHLGGDTPHPGVPVATATGQLVAAPFGPAALAILAIPLAVLHAARVLARLVLRYRSPAELRVSARGVTIVSRTEMLGRTLGQREIHVPKEALLRATREIRFPRLAVYAGLFMLALGSYVGISLFVDGARSGSPELLGIGALVAALGIALDYVLENVVSGARGRCRVVVVPIQGRAVAVGDLDPRLADAALARLAG